MEKKRNKQHYPGLQKSKNLKIRQDLIDQDYIDVLSEEEKDWLDRFNREYVGAEFNHNGEVLHNTEELRKDCEKRNNDRNNDTYGIKKSTNGLKNLHNKNEDGFHISDKLEFSNRSTNLNITEDVLIKVIDSAPSNIPTPSKRRQGRPRKK